MPAGTPAQYDFEASGRVPLSGNGGYVAPITYDVTYAHGMRLLVDGFSDALIRLRRALDDAESDFSDDGDGVLDIAAVNTWIGASSATCVTVYEQSGNNYDITQATDGDQPDYIPDKNGHPALQPGGGDFLQTAGEVVAQPYETYVVWQNASQVREYLYDSTIANPRSSISIDNAPAGTLNMFGRTGQINSAADVTDADTHYSSGQFDGPDSIMLHDGAQVAAGDAGSDGLNGLTVLANYLEGSSFVSGHWYEQVLLGDGLNTAPRRVAFGANQAAFYGVS